jgi:hypothetical protein
MLWIWRRCDVSTLHQNYPPGLTKGFFARLPPAINKRSHLKFSDLSTRLLRKPGPVKVESNIGL